VVSIIMLRRLKSSRWHTCTREGKLDGHTVLLTGGNSGIGLETAWQLADRGAHVIITCRDDKKADDAVKQIRTHTQHGHVVAEILDLSSFESIRDFSSRLLSKVSQLDHVLLNAGVAMDAALGEKTAEGLEMSFGVNHVGHFYLTQLLLDKLIKPYTSRIIVVSSLLYKSGYVDFNNLNGELGYSTSSRGAPANYKNSKLCNALFTRELARRLQDTQVKVCAVSPGFCRTGLFRYMQASTPLYKQALVAPFMLLAMKSSYMGSQTLVDCVLREDLETDSLYDNCEKLIWEPPANSDEDLQTAAKLWEVTQNIIQEKTTIEEAVEAFT